MLFSCSRYVQACRLRSPLLGRQIIRSILYTLVVGSVTLRAGGLRAPELPEPPLCRPCRVFPHVIGLNSRSCLQNLASDWRLPLSSASMASAAAAAVSDLPEPLGAPPATAPPSESVPHALETPSPKKRRQAPKIDIDAAIARHMADVKEAAKMVHEARKQARNEKRKKQRLMRKAASLTPEDLERIAVLKRCGLWQPSVEGLAAPAADSGTGAASSSSTGSPSAAAEPPALPPPASLPSEAGENSRDENSEEGD